MTHPGETTAPIQSADLSGIIERLQNATGPNYALEVDIFKLFNPDYRDFVEGRGGLVHPNDGEDQRVLSNVRPPNVTASVDAAIALAERVLPGCFYLIGKGKTRHDEPPFAAQILFGSDEVLGEAETDANLAIALVLATLRALQSKGEA